MSTTPIPAPVPETPTSVTSSNTTFWQYLTNFWKYHVAVIVIAGLIVGGIIVFNHFRDAEAELKAQEAITATLQQKFQQIGSAGIAANTQQSSGEVQSQATDAFGAALIQQMANQGAAINSLTTLVGTTQQQVSQLQGSLTPFQTATKSTTGALTGYTLEESRTPPLDSVNLHYDPTQPDPANAFKGTTWDAYQETFNASVGDWELQKTGGYKTSVALSRTVSKPDPSNPGKMVVVGTEQIPITGSNTIYTPNGLKDAIPPVPQPRWTLDVGLGKSSTGNVTPAGTIGYRLFNRYGLFAGAVNNGVVGGVSIQLGGAPNK